MRQVKRQIKPSQPPITVSGDNKDFWGPCMWRSIHSMAAVYTPENASSFYNFIVSLMSILPCASCRNNLRKNLREIPPLKDYLDDNQKLFYWTYLLHDKVNKELGKKSPPYQKVKEVYFGRLNSKTCASCKA